MEKIIQTITFFIQLFPNALLAIIANSDLRNGLEFDCNLEASLFQGAGRHIDLNLTCI